jgi:hypothetical protein
MAGLRPGHFVFAVSTSVIPDGRRSIRDRKEGGAQGFTRSRLSAALRPG